MKYCTLPFIFLLSLASSCQKEDMPSTDGHKNIFRCKVNGVEWTPHCISDFFGCSAIDCQYYREDRAFEITVKREYSDGTIDQGLSFAKYNTVLGNNIITDKSIVFSDLNNPSGCFSYTIDSTLSRIFTLIEVDTIEFTIMGTFEFTAFNNCQDTVRITDGYFNVEYRF
jgi:hypothetical protein